MALLEQHLLDDFLPELVVQPEVSADDDAGDEHDDRALDHLVLAGPLDLLQLCDRLADEPEESAAARRLDLTGRTIRRSAAPPRPRAASRATTWSPGGACACRTSGRTC